MRQKIPGAMLAALLAVPFAQPAQAGFSPPRADFDGDGYGDLAIGIPGDTVSGRASAGSVVILYGRAEDPTKPFPFRARAQVVQQGRELRPGVSASRLPDRAEAGDAFGAALAVGDFDLDGYTDLAIGIPGEDRTIKGSNRKDVGAVQIVYGGPKGLRTAGKFFSTLPGPQARAGDRFGSALTALRVDPEPFNGRLAVGLAVGLPGANERRGGWSMGAGSLISRGWNGDEQERVGFFGSWPKGSRVGSALAAGDFDRDGTDDLAVGAPGYDPKGNARDLGAVFVYSNIPDVRVQTFMQGAGGPGIDGLRGDRAAGDRFGSVLATAGHAFGSANGAAVLLVGVPDEDVAGQKDAGLVHVIASDGTELTSSAPGTRAFTQGDIAGSAVAIRAGNRFGAAVTTAFFGDDELDLPAGAASRGAARSGTRPSGGGGARSLTSLVIGVPGQTVGDRAGAGAVLVQPWVEREPVPDAARRWTQDTKDILERAEAGDAFGSSLAADLFRGGSVALLAIGVPGEGYGGRTKVGVAQVIAGRYRSGAERGGLAAAENQLIRQSVGGIVDLPPASNDRFGLTME
jgi:hypothetical protein